MTPEPPSQSADVAESRLEGGEIVLLHLESGQYHELNPVGAEIWRLLDGKRGVSDITAALRERVDEPPEDLEDVVRNFLAELRRRDLLS